MKVKTNISKPPIWRSFGCYHTANIQPWSTDSRTLEGYLLLFPAPRLLICVWVCALGLNQWFLMKWGQVCAPSLINKLPIFCHSWNVSISQPLIHRHFNCVFMKH